jgi:hydroxyacylglutathione hydrolase
LNPIVPQVIVLRTSYLFLINYTYLIVDHVGNEAVIVDPAWQINKIEQELQDSKANLKGILLTHAHPDHINLANPLADKYDCPLWMSHEEIKSSGFKSQRLVGRDEIPWSVGHMRIQPIFTPGHTPGSTCYLIADNLFTGDTLFAEGCGLCANEENAYLMFYSLMHLRESIRLQTQIYPGHSYGKPPGQIFASVLNDNIYLNFKNKYDFAAYRLRKGQNRSKVFDFF